MANNGKPGSTASEPVSAPTAATAERAGGVAARGCRSEFNNMKNREARWKRS
jgi:hypothetical protein